MNFINQLRTSTKDLHKSIEALPISQRLANGVLEIETYLCLLGDLYHIYNFWETDGQAALTALGHPWPRSSSRRAAILRDLTFWNRELISMPTIVNQWYTYLNTQKQPLCCAGAGYVLEGSRLGSHLIGRQLARQWGYPPSVGNGLDYHLDGIDHLTQYWPAVMQYLEQLGSIPEQGQVIISAAINTFQLLYDLHAKYHITPNTTDTTVVVAQEIVP